MGKFKKTSSQESTDSLKLKNGKFKKKNKKGLPHIGDKVKSNTDKSNSHDIKTNIKKPQMLNKKKNTIQNTKKNKNKYAKLQDSEVTSTTTEATYIGKEREVEKEGTNSESKVTGLSGLWTFKPRTTLLVKAGPDWCAQLIDEEEKGNAIEVTTIRKLKEVAAQIIENDVSNYRKRDESGGKKGDIQFRKTVFSHGTQKDKMAAHILECMESPVHSLSHLELIIASIVPKGKRDFIETFGSLKELLHSTLLPKGHVARDFDSHNFSCLMGLMVAGREQAEKQLALWYFEDKLKGLYKKLVRQLAQATHDQIEKNKSKAIHALLSLLSNHPNQEAEDVIEAVVNKFGDPSRKIAGQTMHGLRSLLIRRPHLKPLVVTWVEIVLFRPNMKDKAKYYCLCFLKDMIFSDNDHKLAEKLIKLYFGFFKACTKKGEVDTRMMGALLRGLNRAFPYARSENADLAVQLNTLYKLCHLVGFNIATQALQLIYQVMGNTQIISDRFYQILYRQLQDKDFGISASKSAFLNLVFKAMRKDESLQRIRAFIKRLLQISQYLSPNVICGVLYLISEVVKEKPSLKSVKEALLQANLQNDDDNDDVECYPDLDADEDDIDEKEEVSIQTDKLEKTETENTEEESQTVSEFDELLKEEKPSTSWVHRANFNVGSVSQVGVHQGTYDPYHRNPLYCGADYSPLWELEQLQNHYHPSVALFANKLLTGEDVEYSGDPLQDFTLTRFLDRFVYRNPKKMSGRNDSAGGNVLGRKSQYVPKGARGIQVNSDEFKNLDANKVPEEDQFFHRYFNEFKLAVKKDPEEDDASSVDDNDFDDYLKKMSGFKEELDSDIDLDFAADASAHSGKQHNDSNSEDEMDAEGSDEEPPRKKVKKVAHTTENKNFEDDYDEVEGEESDFSENEEEPNFEGSEDDDEEYWQDLSAPPSVDSEDDVERPPKKKIRKDKFSMEKDDGDDDGDGSDDELDFDEEDVKFSDDDSIDTQTRPGIGTGRKKDKGFGQKSKKKNSIESMFASADDFTNILEENEGMMDTTSIQALSNKDKADKKQIKWETERNKFVCGEDWKNKNVRQGGRGRGRGGGFSSDRSRGQRFGRGKGFGREGSVGTGFGRGGSGGHNFGRDKSGGGGFGKKRDRGGSFNRSRGRGTNPQVSGSNGSPLGLKVNHEGPRPHKLLDPKTHLSQATDNPGFHSSRGSKVGAGFRNGKNDRGLKRQDNSSHIGNFDEGFRKGGKFRRGDGRGRGSFRDAQEDRFKDRRKNEGSWDKRGNGFRGGRRGGGFRGGRRGSRVRGGSGVYGSGDSGGKG
ncbi:nucleolar complex protein 1 isoform X2 [Oratosquilla oratoria]